jgi:hypothetical protein
MRYRLPLLAMLVVVVVEPTDNLVAGGGAHGPRITITADGEPFVNQALRDNEEVSSEQLGNYLARLTFASTAKLAIKPDQGNADRAVVKAKFKLSVVDQRTKKTVVTMEIEELRLGRSKSDREKWFLTREGIELLEQAYAEKVQEVTLTARGGQGTRDSDEHGAT